MANRGADQASSNRSKLERLMSEDMRALTAQSDRLGRCFARRQKVGTNDFDALLHIRVAEAVGQPLTSSELKQRMDVSPAAVTYLVDRMIDAGHIRREADPTDRRKSLLRYEKHGLAVADAFFGPLRAHITSAMSDLSGRDLTAAHRVFTAIMAAMAAYEDELRDDVPKREVKTRRKQPIKRTTTSRAKSKR